MTPSSTDVAPPASLGSPLYRALLDAYRSGRDGVITVFRSGEDARTPITLRQGRVVSVAHESTTIQGVVSVLVRVGILSDRDLAKAQREAARREVYLEDFLVQRGLVSKGTIAATREKAAVELLMDFLLRPDLEVTATWSVLRGVRDTFALPIPYLLKEAQRRASLEPAIRRTVVGSDSVFAKTSDVQGRGAPARWEDLKMSAAERQVYFFVDGRRTVADLILATSQSEFEVSLALHGLAEMKLVAPVPGGGPGNALLHAARSSTQRLLGLTFAVLVLLGSIYLVLAMGSGGGDSTLPRPGTSPFESLLQEAPLRRVAGAARIADLYGDVDLASYEDLVRAGLALPEDRRAAILLRAGGTDPREAPGAGPETPEGREGDAAERGSGGARR